MPATQILGDKDLGLLDDNYLWCATIEHSEGKLGAKKKAIFSFKYLSNTLALFAQVNDLPVLHTGCKLWTKSVCNLVRTWMVPQWGLCGKY